MWSASCAVVRMARVALSHFQRTSTSLGGPLRTHLASSLHHYILQSRRKRRTGFSGTKTHRLSVFFVPKHRDCVLLAASSSLRLQTHSNHARLSLLTAGLTTRSGRPLSHNRHPMGRAAIRSTNSVVQAARYVIDSRLYAGDG
jgi:hypothetical protein